MTDLRKRIISLAILGAACGFLIPPILHLFGVYPDELILNGKYFFIQVIGTGLLGAVNFGSTVVYGIESWGLGKATLIHYPLVLGSFLIANFALGWFPLNVIVYVIIFMTVGYFLIWIIEYLIGKKQIEKMNHDLEELLKEDKNE